LKRAILKLDFMDDLNTLTFTKMETKNLFKSLAAFQQEVPVIHKGTQGYSYTYADLPAIFAVINPLLKKQGLGFTQLISGTSLKTVIFHTETGETIESEAAIPQGVNLKGMNEFQVLGSAITYIRRYALSSALGLITDKDTDAAGEQVKAPNKAAKIPLKVGDANWPNVVKAVQGGFKIEQVKSKYEFDASVELELKTQTK
jgi:hypothetical protein